MFSTMISRCVFCPNYRVTTVKLANAKGFRLYTTASSSFLKEADAMKTSTVESNRIYVLGVGNIGLLFAHSLATTLNPPPITLLLHRPSLLEEWEGNRRQILLVKKNLPNAASGIDVELVKPLGEPQPTIKNLIVATKATKTVEALSSIAHRLTPASTILFTQNGMGVISQVNSSLFPNSSKRPCYLAAVNTHGVKSSPSQPFNLIHAGIGKVTIGPDSTTGDVKVKDLQGRYLLDRIVHAENLVASEVDSPELFKQQLGKLVVNMVINPLTTLLDCENGRLFQSGEICKVVEALVGEASEVLKALPDFEAEEDRFDKNLLMLTVHNAVEATSSNISSMLQDSRAGRQTEIDFINGWIIEEGKAMGKELSSHELLVKLVKSGIKIPPHRAKRYFGETSLDEGTLEAMIIHDLSLRNRESTNEDEDER